MTRERLPNRRGTATDTFRHGAFAYTYSVGYHPDGRIGEVFLTAGKKTGMAVEIIACDLAVLISIAIQHGTPIAELRDAVLREADGSPASPAGALLDALSALGPPPAPEGEPAADAVPAAGGA